MVDAPLPERLQEMVELIEPQERSIRIQLLIDIGERFESVPERIATRPFGRDVRVPACESEAYVWAEPRADGTLDYHFAVENPQGISAKALAAILKDTLSGVPVAEVAEVPSDVVYRLFGSELSMGKSMGLMSMVSMVKNYAQKAMAARKG